MKRIVAPQGVCGGVLIACLACSSNSTTQSQAGGGAGGSPVGGTSSGGTSGASTGIGGMTIGVAGGSGGSTTLTAGGGTGGTPTAGGAAGSGGMITVMGGMGGTSGGAPGGGAGGATSGAGGMVGASGQGGGTGVAAGCANDPHPLCMDFESPFPATWTGGNTNAVVSTEFAHGGHSYQLYKCNDATAPTEGAKCQNSTSGGKFVSMNVGTITNQIWGRFYLHASPGVPGGHGNIVAACEDAGCGAWYELGWQFDGMMGVWHNGGENPIRSMPYIVDQWYCVELLFDGAAAAMPKWYIDGTEAAYYKDEPNNPTKPHMITQFDHIEVGFTPYAGLEIRQPDGVGDQTEMRMLAGMWIDDIAFDDHRIGCIAGPVGQ
ncbi:MAG TPA: hypothetical protein VL137_08035 [Polyangiaceae bacterium]|nr:hypothetical protein [Polyangiaceae bacterium]